MFKRITLLLSFCLLSFMTLAADNKPFTGHISAADLLNEYPKFASEYESFTVNAADTKAIQKLADKELLVLFGTWCHDSMREVPRLLKLLDTANVKVAQLRLVAVGYNKQDPEGIAQQYDLRYTPTIIVLDNKKELNRMVEKPTQSLAIDLAQF